MSQNTTSAGAAGAATMRAWVLDAPGGPEAFALRELPVPTPAPGQVLIAIAAFGLNRSEWFTRRGDSPSVRLPRVLGIECVGEVVAAPGGEFAVGQRVVAMMGGMGRAFDGSYAEMTCVPAEIVFAVDDALDWPTLAALPEMMQTVQGSLRVGLDRVRLGVTTRHRPRAARPGQRHASLVCRARTAA